MNQIKDVQVYDVEKRYVPSKHYAYCIMVTEKNNAKHIIYRRYSEFFKLHSRLLDRFKEESGAKDPLNRILPHLPPKKLLGRSHVKSVALARLYPLDIYCKKLISLKKEISDSDLVKSFFSVNDNDITQSINEHNLDKKVKKYEVPKEISTPIKGEEYMTICDFEAQGLTELSVKKNTKVSVLEKDMSGWWLVENADGFGYIPSSILNITEQQPLVLENPELNIVIRDFDATLPNEMSIRKAEYVYVIEKNYNGYWKAKINNRIGYVPANHLQLPNEPHKNRMEDQNSSFDESDEEYMPKVNKSNQSNGFRLSNESSNLPKQFNESNQSNIYLPNIMSNDQPSALSNYTSIEKFIVVEDYLSPDNETISLRKGQIVQVLDSKSSSEWWFIQIDDLKEGWAPSSFLKKYDSSHASEMALTGPDFSSRLQKLNLSSNENVTLPLSIKEPQKSVSNKNLNYTHSYTKSNISLEENDSYLVKADYTSPDSDSLSLRKGQIVRVINNQNPDGWWLVRLLQNNQEGWAPSSFLNKIDAPKTKPQVLSKKPNVLPKPRVSNNFQNNLFASNQASYNKQSQQMTMNDQDTDTSNSVYSVKELRAKLEQNFLKR